MSRKRYIPEQIISMLREAEVALAQGQSIGQACRTLGVLVTTVNFPFVTTQNFSLWACR